MRNFPLYLCGVFVALGIAFQVGWVDTAVGYYRYIEAGFPEILENCPYSRAYYTVRDGEVVEFRCLGGEPL